MRISRKKFDGLSEGKKAELSKLAHKLVKKLAWESFDAVCLECGGSPSYYVPNVRNMPPTLLCRNCKTMYGVKGCKLIRKSPVERAERKKELNKLRQKKFRDRRKTIVAKVKERQKGGQGGNLLCPTLDKANFGKEFSEMAGVSHDTGRLS